MPEVMDFSRSIGACDELKLFGCPQGCVELANARIGTLLHFLRCLTKRIREHFRAVRLIQRETRVKISNHGIIASGFDGKITIRGDNLSPRFVGFRNARSRTRKFGESAFGGFVPCPIGVACFFIRFYKRFDIPSETILRHLFGRGTRRSFGLIASRREKEKKANNKGSRNTSRKPRRVHVDSISWAVNRTINPFGSVKSALSLAPILSP